MPAEIAQWRRCSSCKTPIAFGAAYWCCNVSTCNRPRTALHFCSVSCWDAHLSVVNHRESWALERRAPSREAWEHAQHPTSSPPRQGDRLEHRSQGGEAAAQRGEAERSSSGRAAAPQAIPREVLIVASKLKAYVRARSGFHTSDRVLDPLSDAVRELCDRAIEKARAEGRSTLLERDLE